METTEAALQTKLIQLKITVERTSKILDTGNREAIERHQKALKALITEADQYKRDEEAKKIVSKQDLTEIGEWNAEIETKLANADHEINRLKQWCDEYKQECDEVQKKQELEFERQLFETRLKFQNELHAAKANQEAQLSKQTTTATVEATKGSQAKLPKLVITKFNGTCQDWPRFWEQFRETVDKTGIEPVIKFAYLRELLDTKVRRSVEALPFTSEGYNRATSILQERYGKQSEIIKAYTMQILDLPTIPNANVRRIHEFTDKLTYAVQSLETLGKLQQVNGNVAMTLDKLPGIRGDLVRTDDSWETWDFVKLTEALRLWTRRNPIEKTANDKSNDRSNKLYNTRRQDHKPRECIYCEDASHKSNECPNVTSVTERRQILQKRRLCFNCTGTAHRAAECQSKAKCQKCDRRHHTSICDKKDKAEGIKEEKLLISTGESAEGSFPIVKIKVDGIECRALIDSGAGSSYASAKLINLLQKKPIEAKDVRVDMLMSTQLIHLETYGTVIESVNGEFKLEVNLVKVNKEKLLSVDNPCYKELIKKYPHLKGVEVDDHDTKAQLPVHVVLSSGEYARIKTNTKPRVGQDGEPIAELTKLGWFVMSPGKEFDHNKMLMTQTSQTEYEELCRLDVLGLEDTPENDQESVYSEFKEQLVRDEQGWYETGLTWKGNHPELPTNKKGSLHRLDNLVRKLERTDKYNDYDEIITDQLREGVIEPAPEEPSKKEFYIPHKMVMKESGESTKLRVVYDASAREQLAAPSLNECLNPGPSLQNKLWNVLVRQRSYPVAVCGDIQKAFLQVRIKECERDALRFHWKHPGQDEVQVYRFTRALFGLTCSPFLLGGVINQHLELWQSRQPEIVAELRQNLYVDDLLTGGNTIEETQAKKSSMVEILNDAAFKLHKWNANASELEEDGDTPKVNEEQTFAKQQLGVLQHESKVLGLPWDKTADTLTVPFPKDSPATTKRGILSKLAKIYDPLGLVSPITLLGKMIYRDVCDEKTSWESHPSSTMGKVGGDSTRGRNCTQSFSTTPREDPVCYSSRLWRCK